MNEKRGEGLDSGGEKGASSVTSVKARVFREMEKGSPRRKETLDV